MPTARGQTGFQPPARDIERRAFFDLLRRIKVLEDGGGGGGGGDGANEVFIGPSTPVDPAVELWVDSDATPVPGEVVPTQFMSAAGSGSFTATSTVGGQVPGLAITIPVRPYPRSALAVCNIGLTWISGGANNYWAATFNWTGIAAGASRSFFWPRGPTGHGQGTCQVLIAPDTAAYVSLTVIADISASAAVSGTWLDVMLTPAGALL